MCKYQVKLGWFLVSRGCGTFTFLLGHTTSRKIVCNPRLKKCFGQIWSDFYIVFMFIKLVEPKNLCCLKTIIYIVRKTFNKNLDFQTLYNVVKPIHQQSVHRHKRKFIRQTNPFSRSEQERQARKQQGQTVQQHIPL